MTSSKIIIKLYSLLNSPAPPMNMVISRNGWKPKRVPKRAIGKDSWSYLDMECFQRFPIEEERCKTGGKIQNVRISLSAEKGSALPSADRLPDEKPSENPRVGKSHEDVVAARNLFFIPAGNFYHLDMLLLPSVFVGLLSCRPCHPCQRGEIVAR